jgi:hypothetical protein
MYEEARHLKFALLYSLNICDDACNGKPRNHSNVAEDIFSVTVSIHVPYLHCSRFVQRQPIVQG